MPPFGAGQHLDAVELFLDESKLAEVRKRKKPTKYFWCDMTDLFGSWVKAEWIQKCFQTMDETPRHTHLLLTKRPENILKMWPARSDYQYVPEAGEMNERPMHYRENCWIGCSISDQETANTMLPELLKCRDLSPVLFTSYEPALGPVEFTMIRDPNRFPGCAYFDVLKGQMIHEDDDNQWTKEPHLDWLICGGESGPNARPYDLEWARSTIKQCADANVPCFHKQIGSITVDSSMSEGGMPGIYLGVKDKKGGRMEEWPEPLRVRQFPVV
jgi:protein gp37